MANDLITQDDFSKQLVELDKIQDTCKKLLATRHYQSLGEAGIHGIIARSKALGIHPFEALNGMFYNVNGKIGMSTETMAALVRKRGHSITKDPKSTNEICILHGKRADTGDTWTCSFSRADAEAAGLWNGPTWRKYPAVMLYNRCMSMLFRQLFPDLSMGAGYVEDELKEIAKIDEYKLPVSECEILSTKQNNETPTLANREKLLENLREVLDICGKDYEKKILKHYEVDEINELKDSDIHFVMNKALAFKEIRMKQNESNPG